LLEEKAAIPAIKKQLDYLSLIQESGFWEGITLDLLEECCSRLQELVPLLDRKNPKSCLYRFQR